MKQKFTHSAEQKIDRAYFKKPTPEFVKYWYKIARNNRKAGIPIKDTLEQANLVMQGIRLRMDFEHNAVIEQETHIKTVQETMLQEYQNNFKDFVAVEMIKLAERKFRRMDRLKAILEKLKSRIEEFKKITSLK